MEKATFAAERFFGAEPAFRAVDGVSATRVGTADGYEAVEVDYDPWTASYDALLEVFWRESDPSQPSAIFPHTVEQHAAAAASREREQAESRTEIRPAPRLVPAES